MKPYSEWFWDVGFVCFLFAGIASLVGAWNLSSGQPLNTPLPQPAGMITIVAVLALIQFYLKLSHYKERSATPDQPLLSYFESIIIMSPLLICITLVSVVNSVRGLPITTRLPEPFNGLLFGCAFLSMFLLLIHRALIQRLSIPNETNQKVK